MIRATRAFDCPYRRARKTQGSSATTGAAWIDGYFVMALNGGRAVAWPDDPGAARTRLCEDFGSRISDEEWAALVPGVPLTDGC